MVKVVQFYNQIIDSSIIHDIGSVVSFHDKTSPTQSMSIFPLSTERPGNSFQHKASRIKISHSLEILRMSKREINQGTLSLNNKAVDSVFLEKQFLGGKRRLDLKGR